MEVQIRKLCPEESNSYRKMRLECLKNYPFNFTSDFNTEKEKVKLFFQSSIEASDPNNFVIGAYNGYDLIGISGFNRYKKIKIAHKGRIIQVYVSPNYQRQNIGLRLIKYTIEEAFKISGIEQIEIAAIATNKNAERLYKKIGFIEYGTQKNFMKVDNTYYDHKMMILFKNQYISVLN
ncbi:GNAT family protein [uncultured Winogradskyella sp.]|uniref:GNAT family N-acetyltransferase n=1 Tax=uncultured Winogradskyella sp. TaxID=395353 RepID=UPI0026218150|nr:GNAT family protein [uncultured Winogradskyella sp.]